MIDDIEKQKIAYFFNLFDELFEIAPHQKEVKKRKMNQRSKKEKQVFVVAIDYDLAKELLRLVNKANVTPSRAIETMIREYLTVSKIK